MKMSKKKVLKQVAGLVGLTLAGTASAFAGVTGLGQDIGHIIKVASDIPTLETIVFMGAGVAAMGYGGWHIHKKGDMENQGKKVGFHNIALPIAGGAFLAAIPFMTGAAQHTFYGDGNKVTTSASYLNGNHLGGSSNVTIP
ncbi:hypothetical protein HFU84_08675 [Acidithiobacillus sp. CV18-2]|nr:hypothetical protein [Acidithiobacillus sp. CV18-3]MBU2756966.1 hypothetical protein [Acidithiobacillus sp. BN09-2]MBU2777577.1 hypothetical protein [Acidithiobacillus sp. CV18-2]MBU2799677.1 hypothetical protein [Acidithiobacillus sp. VAN18-4]